MTAPFELGDVVVVTRGPFVSLCGVVWEVDVDRSQVRLDVRVENHQRTVYAEFDEVELL
ncbi:hypothetical protein [Antrihabitans cavernicola]|uniref:hypothetical protein n=1 Tax=Antrihabitans cavernicola TaxID=2495913 RepID=UPI0016596F0C|nr:hypothetical protein [Spelaeibacter cavernicola]